MRRVIFNVVAVVCAIVVGGCSVEKGSLLTPSADAVVQAPTNGSGNSSKPLSLVIGTWTGAETASYGESGTLSAAFTHSPALDGVVAATLSWTSALTSLTFNGTLTGTLDAMVITVTNGPGNACGYTAVGALNEAGTQITGTYTGTGPAPCPSKAGSFILNGQSYVPQPVVSCGSTFYYQMLNGNATSKQNKCENTATPKGSWLGAYDIPDDNPVGGTYQDVCKFTPTPPGDPGNDMLLLSSTPNVCPL